MAHKYRVTGELPLDLNGSGERYVKGQEFTADFNSYEEAHLIAAGAIEPVRKADTKTDESKEG